LSKIGWNFVSLEFYILWKEKFGEDKRKIIRKKNPETNKLNLRERKRRKTTKRQEKTEEEQHQLHYLGFSIHQEVASDSFCFLINSSWLLVFILFLFLHALGLNLYCWKGIHFS